MSKKNGIYLFLIAALLSFLIFFSSGCSSKKSKPRKKEPPPKGLMDHVEKEAATRIQKTRGAQKTAADVVRSAEATRKLDETEDETNNETNY